MNLSEVHGPGVSEQLERTAHVDSDQGQALAEQRLVERQVVALGKLADAELVVAENGSFLQPRAVADRE